MKTQTQNSKEPPYSRPQLAIYGDIRQITQANASGVANDGSGLGMGANKTG